MFCWHEWVTIDKEVIPSPAEQIGTDHCNSAPLWAFQRKIIYTRRCIRCKRIRIDEFTGPN